MVIDRAKIDYYKNKKFGDKIDQSVEHESLTLYHDALLHFCSGDIEGAYKLLIESAAMRPHAKTFERLFTVLSSLGRDGEALMYLEEAYNMNPRNMHTATMYAEVLFARGNIEVAKFIVDAILNQSATFGPARKLLIKLESIE